MLLLLINLLWSAPILSQEAQTQAAMTEVAVTEDVTPNFAMRAKLNLRFGSGIDSGRDYYDVPITRRPADGVLIKLPYTLKGGKLTFDMHHRVGMSDDFGLPAEIMTVVEVLTGGTNQLGTYTLLDDIDEGDRFEEQIDRASDADIDRYVTPMSRKQITIKTTPGPQSISIVGRDMVITRGALSTEIDTPGTRIAMISNIKFEAVTEINPLKKSPGPNH
jgi:hypothetical protein